MLPRNRRVPGLRQIRQTSNVPIIMLSAKGEVFDKVLGLELGADDYIIKPFDSKELVARVKAVLRRYQPALRLPRNRRKIRGISGSQHQSYNYSVIYKGETVDMPPKELELLYFLASSPNQVIYQGAASGSHLGDMNIGDTRTVDVHIKRLREKIKDNDYWTISTVWGIGYKFGVKTP